MNETSLITNPTTLVDQKRIRWQGSGSFPVKTPFGFYDSDSVFQTEAYSAAIWAAKALGFPVIDIELLDVNFYARYEIAWPVQGNPTDGKSVHQWLQFTVTY